MTSVLPDSPNSYLCMHKGVSISYDDATVVDESYKLSVQPLVILGTVTASGDRVLKTVEYHSFKTNHTKAKEVRFFHLCLPLPSVKETECLMLLINLKITWKRMKSDK